MEEEEEGEEEGPTHPSGRAANGQQSIGTSDMHATQREQRSRKSRDVEEERDKAAEEEEEEEEDYDYVPSPVMDSMELFPELSAEASAFVDNISTRTRARQPLPDIDFQQLEDMLQEVDDPFEANPQEEDYLRFLFELQDKHPPDATVQPTMTIEEDDDDDYCFQPEEEEEEDTTSQHGMDDEWEIDPEEIEALLSQLEAEQQQQLQQAQQEQQQQQKQLAATTKPIAAAVPIQPLYTHNVFTSDQLVQLQCQLSQHFQLLLQTVFHSLGDKESEPAETAWNLLVEMWGRRDAVIPNNPQLQSSSKPPSAPSLPSSPLRFLTTPTTEPSLSVRRSPRRRPPPPPSSSSSPASTSFSSRTVIPLPSSLLSISKFETEIPIRNKPTLMWCTTRSLFDVPGLHLVPALGSLLNACGWKAAYSRRVLPCPYDYASRSLGVFPPFSQKESLHLLDLFEPFFDPAIKPKRLARKNRRLTFTPAEDDLLLLGLQKYGNKGMAKTQSNLLPTKTVKQLRNRYKNRISGKAEWNSIKAFKEGSRLQCQNPLTQTELQLLTQGVMLYGLDWKTIAFRVLPRRQPHHLSFVWNHLRNLHPSLSSSSSTAAAPSSSSSTTPVTTIAPSSVAASSSAFVSSFTPSASLSTRANPTQTGITPILPPFNALRLPLPPAVVPPPSIIPVTASSSSLPVTTISTSATPPLKSSLSSSVFPLPLLGALHFENEDIIDSSESDHEDEEKGQEDGDTDDVLLYNKDSTTNKTSAYVNTEKEVPQNASVPRPSSSPSSLASTTPKQMFEEEDLFDSDEEEEEAIESDDDNKK
ncbi:hypothetical protein QOT17_001369 [Balamuthia mandrillaris]